MTPLLLALALLNTPPAAASPAPDHARAEGVTRYEVASKPDGLRIRLHGADDAHTGDMEIDTHDDDRTVRFERGGQTMTLRWLPSVAALEFTTWAGETARFTASSTGWTSTSDAEALRDAVQADLKLIGAVLADLAPTQSRKNW